MIAIAALVVLHPVLADAGVLRLAASGTLAEPVEWLVDGQLIGTTHGEALTVAVAAGNHTVLARSGVAAGWMAMARLEPAGPGVQYVPAWTGMAQAVAHNLAFEPTGVFVLALAGCLLVRRLAKRP